MYPHPKALLGSVSEALLTRFCEEDQTLDALRKEGLLYSLFLVYPFWQATGEETLASTLFMKQVRNPQPPKGDDGAGKGQKKKRRSIYAQPKRMKRISFPQPAKC